MVTDASVVGGHLRAPEQPGALRPGRVAKTQEGGNLPAEAVLPDGQRCDAHPAPDEQRLASVPGRAKPDAERTKEQKFFARPRLAEAPGARPHVLDQELQLDRLGAVGACAGR